MPNLRHDSITVKGDKSLSDVVASEIVRELKRPRSKINSNETKKAAVSGWMTVDPLKVGFPSKTETFQIHTLGEVNNKRIDPLGEVDTNHLGASSKVDINTKSQSHVTTGSDPRTHKNFDESVWKTVQATRTGIRSKQRTPSSDTKPTMAPYQGTPSPAFTEPSVLLLKIRDNFNKSVWTPKARPTMGPYQGTRSPAFSGSKTTGMWKNNINESVWTTRSRPTMGPYQGTRSPAFTGSTNTGMWKNSSQWPSGKNVVVMKSDSSDSSLKSIIRNGVSEGVTTLRNGLKRTNTRVRSQATSRLRSGVESLWTGFKNGVKNGMDLGTRTLRRAFTPRIRIRRPVASGNFGNEQDVEFTEQLDTTPLLLLR